MCSNNMLKIHTLICEYFFILFFFFFYTKPQISLINYQIRELTGLVRGDKHVELDAARLTDRCSRMRQGGQLQSNDKVLRCRRQVAISGKGLWSSINLQYICTFMICCCCECWMPTELAEW